MSQDNLKPQSISSACRFDIPLFQLRNGAPFTRLPSDKLKAVIPPFLPPSNFEVWSSDRIRMNKDGKMEHTALSMPRRFAKANFNSSGNSDIVRSFPCFIPL